jgi:hypothetical protein
MNDVILAPSASPYAPESPRTFDDLAGTLASNQAVFITEPWFVFIAPKNVDLTSMFEKPPRHIKHSLRDDERFAYWFQLENPFKPWREHRFTMFHSANQFRDSIEINFDRTGFDWPIESVKIWSELKISGDVQLVDGAPLATTITGVLLDEGLISELNAARMERGEQPYLFINSRGQGGQTLQDIEEAGICFEDVAFRLQQPAYEALRGVYARMVRERYGDEIGELFKSAMLEACAEAGGATRKLSDMMCISIVADNAKIFENQVMERFAELQDGTLINASSLRLEDAVRTALFKASHRFPSDSQVKNSIRLQPVNKCMTARRVAAINGEHFIDVGDGSGEVYAIRPGQWGREVNGSIKFLRSREAAPLSVVGIDTRRDLGRLFHLINVEESDHILVLAWLIESLRAGTPYPLLQIAGKAGSAKTTTSRILRDLVDPQVSKHLQAMPSTVEDLNVAVFNVHVLALDNVSSLNAKVQDQLCVIATGGVQSKRQLYTDGDQFVVETHSPIIINGVPELASRSDLLSRAVTITLTRPTAYRDVTEVDAEFEEHKAEILAGLLQLFADALAILPEIGPSTHRLSDFTRLGRAIAKVLHDDESVFTVAFDSKDGAKTAAVLESNEAARSIVDYFNTHHEIEELNASSGKIMNAVMGESRYYLKAKAFKDDVLRAQSELAEVGITVGYEDVRAKVSVMKIRRSNAFSKDSCKQRLDIATSSLARLTAEDIRGMLNVEELVSNDSLTAAKARIRINHDIERYKRSIEALGTVIAELENAA